MRFLHCADIHLGARRFGSDRLTGDFSTSFKRMAEDAVRREVNAVIMSGRSAPSVTAASRSLPSRVTTTRTEARARA